MPVFEKSSELPVSGQAAFEWHCRPGAFGRLAPPWEAVELVETAPVEDRSRTCFRLRIGPFRKLWVAEHRDIQPGLQFCDVQLRGPFARWQHTHRMQPHGPNRCLLSDRIEYALPLGFLGQLFGGRLIQRQLERSFLFRHEVTKRDLQFHAASRTSTPMKIAIGGSTGLVGSALIPFLTTGGHEVVRLMRGGKQPADGTSAVEWNPAEGTIDSTGLDGCDAVVHLGGHNIAGGRWSTSMKNRLRESRVNSTELLSKTMASLANPPKVFVCASAIGFYGGDRGDELLNEDSQPGSKFISQLCQDWENAVAPAREAGIRVINLRIGVVLSPQGGALQKMLLPFKLGGGGVVGNGKQWWSWVSIEDLPRIMLHCLTTESLSGPVNAVAPGAVNNRDFTKTLGRVLRRPTIVPMPAFAVRLGFGEMGEELLLGSTRVQPDRLTQSGYEFAFPELEGALRSVLGRS
jgi:hypothetical protein